MIRDILPHRYPFLLVDKVIEVVKGKSATAQKNVSNNEWFFQGHFPEYPVMPGVLILEALAQTAGLALLDGKTIPLYTGLDKVRFRKQVLPGDVLILKIEVLNSKMGLVKVKGEAFVDNEIACEAIMYFGVKK
jgi:3-hydroxyacyl-[acyl-carrier-protein] dehydratase